jgi:uncharacterized protein involved in outer membrane biogenesis
MKLRLIGIAIAALLVISGVILGIAAAKVDSFRPKIQAELQSKLNRPVDIGHLALRVLPLSIKVDGFRIGEAPEFGTSRPFATANEVFVSAELFSLLTGNPQVKDLVLQQPQIEMTRNAAGKWNFASLGGQSNGGGNGAFSLDKLQINDGQVGFTDLQHQQARAVYDHIDLTLSDFAANKQFGVELGVHFPGDGKQTLAFKGRVGPFGSQALPPVDGHISLQQVSLSGVNRFAAGTIPAQTDTVASGETDVKDGADGLGLKGNLKLENTVVHGSKIDYPIEAKYDLSTDAAFNKLQVKASTVTLGATTLNASGNVDNSVKPANLNLQLGTKDSSITELAKLAGAFGFAFNPDYKIDGRLSMNITAKGPAIAPQLNGNIAATNIAASGGEMKQSVSVAALDLTLTPDAVRSNTFSVRSGATEISISFGLAGYATKSPVADVTLQSTGANIAEVLNIAKAYGVAGTKGASGSGAVSLNIHAQGPTSDPSKLVYAGTASISGATFTTPQLSKPLTITSAQAQFSQNAVTLTNLSAGVGSTTLQGSASVQNFAAPAVQFALSVNKVDTDELQHLTAGPQKSSAAQPGAGGSLLNNVTGGGKLAVGTIKAQDIVLSNVSASIQLNHGEITLSPLSAGAFGGTLSGAITADMRPQTPLCSAKTKLAGIDANALLSAVSSMKNQLYGSLSGTTDLKFALASSADLPRTLNGTLAFSLAKGEIKNVNIMGELAKAGKLLGNTALANSGSSTALKELSGTLNFANGVATTNNLKAALDSGSLTADGSVNLVNQDLNMHVTATLASAGGQTGGGGILGAVLANNKGELVVPVIVTGNTAHMIFAPDVAAMAKSRLGGLLGQKQSPDAKQQANPVNSILNQFLKKKP